MIYNFIEPKNLVIMNYSPKKVKFITPSGSEMEMKLPTTDLTLTINRYYNKEYFVDKVKVNIYLN